MQKDANGIQLIVVRIKKICTACKITLVANAHFCYYHEDEQEEHLTFCSSCTREYCKSCSPAMNRCAKCECCVCSTCEDLIECEDCSDLFCIDCAATRDCCGERMCFTCKPLLICKGEECSKLHCVDCFDGNEYDVMVCEVCDTEACVDCRLLELRKDRITCNSELCQSIRSRGVRERLESEGRGKCEFIKRQNAERKRMQAMIKQTKSEINMLRMMNGRETLPESDQDAPESDKESIEADFIGSDFTYRCHRKTLVLDVVVYARRRLI